MAAASRYVDSVAFTARLTKREKDAIPAPVKQSTFGKTHVLFRVGKELKGRVDAINRDDGGTTLNRASAPDPV